MDMSETDLTEIAKYVGYRFIPLQLERKAIISVQDPIRLGTDSEPQPDLALLTPRPDFYSSGHPGPAEVLLLVEVAETSAGYDREIKLPLYARFGIPEPQPGEAILAPQASAAAAPLAMKAPGLRSGYRPIRLAAGDDRPAIRAANRAADVLADNALARALPIIEVDILAPLRELIESASSLEEIIAALPVLYPELDLERLEELTQQALYIADLNGRYSEHG